MDKIKIIALGGLDEDGKDLYVVEINNDIFVFCAGYKYPTKLTPGIDFIISDFSYLEERKEKIRGYILPKTKENSFGAIPYIYNKCPAPIYCTQLTAEEIKKFSLKYSVNNNYDFKYIELPSFLKINGYDFTFFSTCASMPLTFGFSIKTNLGNIVYSGDFIVEYNNEQFYKLDLNTLGKIAEDPTLILISESSNSGKAGYCSPNHRLYPFFKQCFNDANGRIFVALTNDNLYHIDEFCNICNEYGKTVIFYDKNTQDIFSETGYKKFLPSINMLPADDIFKAKESNTVILVTDDPDRIYEKISILASKESENKNIKLTNEDMFALAISPTDNNEVIATSTIDDLYKSGCNVRYVKKHSLNKMHACEEDLRMLLSLFRPKYYFPIEGYYVDLLSNAKIALDMKLNLNHRNIFLLDNGQSINITDNDVELDFNINSEHCKVGELMIDGIGVGDIVNEIIEERNRLGNDGVVVLGCAVSKSERKISFGPDVQMRGFLYLKDKEAEAILKFIQNTFITSVNEWLEKTQNFDEFKVEEEIESSIIKHLKKTLNREPVIKPKIIVLP